MKLYENKRAAQEALNQAVKSGDLSRAQEIQKVVESWVSGESFDRDAVREFVISELASAAMPKTDELWSALAGITSKVKDAADEQTAILESLYAKVESKFGKNAVNVLKITGRATVPSPENGNKTSYDRLGIAVTERAKSAHEIVHHVYKRVADPESDFAKSDNCVTWQSAKDVREKYNAYMLARDPGFTPRDHLKLRGDNAEKWSGDYESMPVSEYKALQAARIETAQTKLDTITKSALTPAQAAA